jgi:hypothetical protein
MGEVYMSLRVGIITHYHNSINYGGTLQAYALCNVFEKKDCCPSQIKLNAETNISAKTRFIELMKKSPKKAITAILKSKFRKMFVIPLHRKEYGQFIEIINNRKEDFENFRNHNVSQSSIVYDLNNIGESLELYDTFVTGSDQVWHPLACNSAYLLDFVPESKPKFSYAASLSTNHLCEADQLKFQESLKHYLGISVREEDAVELLKPFSPIPPVCSLDPTLLLGKNEWDRIASDRIVNEPYVFCFFLGNSKRQIRIAREYAKKHNLKLVMIPFLSGKYTADEIKSGDLALETASPQDFISLIKYSDMVFTDSFHAVAFSSIYRKEFFVFTRNGSSEMSTRIENITRLFGTCERFLNSKEKTNSDYIEKCSKLKYDDLSKYERALQESMQYLDDTIKKAKTVL